MSHISHHLSIKSNEWSRPGWFINWTYNEMKLDPLNWPTQSNHIYMYIHFLSWSGWDDSILSFEIAITLCKFWSNLLVNDATAKIYDPIVNVFHLRWEIQTSTRISVYTNIFFSKLLFIYWFLSMSSFQNPIPLC